MQHDSCNEAQAGSRGGVKGKGRGREREREGSYADVANRRGKFKGCQAVRHFVAILSK